MQPGRVVMLDKFLHNPPGILQIQGAMGTDSFLFNCFVPPFYFSITLGIERRCSHMRHSADPYEFLEILGNKLRPVVGNDPGPRIRVFSLGPFQYDLDPRFRHTLPDFPMHNESAISIQRGA